MIVQDEAVLDAWMGSHVKNKSQAKHDNLIENDKQ
jgi:hypothetical protein